MLHGKDSMEDRKQTTKDHILFVLKTQGPQTATLLAAQLRVSPMAVRQHLQVLKAESWVTYAEERRPMGRPVKLWKLTEQAQQRFPDSHADLMLDMLHSVTAVFGAAGLDRLLAERSQRQIHTYRASLSPARPSDWQQQVAAIAQCRSQEGYMAEVIDPGSGELLLVENHCPIGAAATACPGLCRAELDVFQAVLGSDIAIERQEHILQGDRRCTYRIRPTSYSADQIA